MTALHASMRSPWECSGDKEEDRKRLNLLTGQHSPCYQPGLTGLQSQAPTGPGRMLSCDFPTVSLHTAVKLSERLYH